MEADNKPVPVILVGCGAVSRFFYSAALNVLAKKNVLSVQTLVDPSEQNLDKVAQLFPAVTKCRSLEEVNISPQHLVIVASPPQLHSQQAILAMESGASVLCEKPMAADVEKAEAMLECARKNNSLLAIGLYKRFFPATETLKGIIDSQIFGKLRFFSIEEGGKNVWQAASDSSFNKSLTPGGVLYNLGVHTLDLLLWWLGEPQNVYCSHDALGGLEANCKIEFVYESGSKGTAHFSRDWATSDIYTFSFERGIVRYKVNEANRLEIIADGMDHLLQGQLVSVSRRGEMLYEQEPTLTNPHAFIQQIVNVVASMKGEEMLRVSGEEGIRSLRLIEKCYKDAIIADMPWLTEEEQKTAAILAQGR